jgi:hypothetical protein
MPCAPRTRLCRRDITPAVAEARWARLSRPAQRTTHTERLHVALKSRIRFIIDYRHHSYASCLGYLFETMMVQEACRAHYKRRRVQLSTCDPSSGLLASSEREIRSGLQKQTYGKSRSRVMHELAHGLW